MALYAISDLHLSLSIDKPMDVFGPTWHDYMNRIKTSWLETITPNDTVLIPGDISWATYLEQTKADFAYIDSLPGKKLVIQGNHDYWWTTVSKLENFLAAEGFSSIGVIKNKAILVDNYIISGTRGWLMPGDGDFKTADRRIYERELARLSLCLNDVNRIYEQELSEGRTAKKIIMTHYPPILKLNRSTEPSRLISEAGIDLCIYGHLHSHGHSLVFEGIEKGVSYRCVSSDYLGFVPTLLDI